MQVLSNTQTILAAGAGTPGPWTSMKWGSSNLGGSGNRTYQVVQNGAGAVTGSIDWSNDGVTVAATTAWSGLSAANAVFATTQANNWAFFRVNCATCTATSVSVFTYGA